MTVPAATKPASKRKIPAYLIKEEMDGVPYYHKGFREVLAKKKLSRKSWEAAYYK